MGIEYFPRFRHQCDVRRLRNFFLILTAFVWLPATLHCQLETLPGLEFLACHAEDSSSESDSHCDDTCCSVEHAAYRSEHQQQTLPAPRLLPILSSPVLVVSDTLPEELILRAHTSVPLGFPSSWQFSSRAALSPRAPSHVS